MDSLNLSSGQNTRVDSQSTGNNTNPVAFTSCGCKDYPPNFPHANCLRTCYPITPNSKESPENCKDNFPVHQPLLSNSPMIQPLFNSPIVPNLYFPQNNFSAFSNFGRLPEEFKQGKNENELLCRQHCPFGNFFQCTTDKTEIKNNNHNNSCMEFQTKQRQTENNSQFQKQKVDPQTNFYNQRCNCNSAVPWTCGPFIVPIISYYVLWNSQRTNATQLSTNQSCSQTKKCSENSTIHLDNINVPSPTPNYINIDKERKEYRNDFENEFWIESNMPKKECKTNGQSCTSFISLNSLNGVEDNLCSFNKKNDENMLHTVDSDNSSLEKSILDESDSALVSTNYEKETEDIDDEENRDIYSSECNDYTNTKLYLETKFYTPEMKNSPSNIQPEISLSSPEFKESGFAGEILHSEIQSRFSDFPSEGITHNMTAEPFDEQLKEKEPHKLLGKTTTKNSSPKVQDRMLKKMIKNFTITNQNYELSEQSATQSPVGDGAAAGDLGGVHCLGYKVRVPLPEGDMKEKRENEIQTDNLEQKETSVKGTSSKLNDKNASKTQLENENLDFTLKYSRNFKSGIAKLSNNFKTKNSPADVVPIIKPETPNNQQKNPTLNKLKHNCLVENKTENKENSSKVIKAKTPTQPEEQVLVSGSNKLKVKPKPASTKTSLLKKDEKISLQKNLGKNIKVVSKK